jgi:hypothetical protein
MCGPISIKKLIRLIQEENLVEGDSIRLSPWEFNLLGREYRSHYKAKMTNPFSISGVEIISEAYAGHTMGCVFIRIGKHK